MAIEKRFPSDYRLLPTTKTMFSDDKIDMQLYNLFQCYSYPYPIKNEEGKITGYETRVYKKDLPTNKEIGELFSRPWGKDKKMTPITEKVVGQRLQYLTNPSATNIYCPYLEKQRDKKGGARKKSQRSNSQNGSRGVPFLSVLKNGSFLYLQTSRFFYPQNGSFFYPL